MIEGNAMKTNNQMIKDISMKRVLRYAIAAFLVMILTAYGFGIGIASATTLNIIDYTDSGAAGSNYMYSECCGSGDLSIGVHMPNGLDYTQTYYLNLYQYSTYPSGTTAINLYSSDSSYNNRVFIQTIGGANGWRNITLNGNGQYFVINITDTAASGNDFVKYNSPTNPTNNPYVSGSVVPTFDPSGYVKDGSGNGIFNAKVQLSNATWTDPCITSCFSDASGFWNTNIYINGTYNFAVSKSGYTTNSGSQAFTTGGTNTNFTLTPSAGLISGHIYTTVSSTGSFPVKGDVDMLKKQFTQSSITSGSTLTLLGAPDGQTYVIKLIDVDSANQQAIIDILKNGEVIFDDQLLDSNQLYQYKIIEDTTQTTYIDVTVTNIFSGGESGRITVNAGYDTQKKDGITFLQFLQLLIAFNPTNPGAWASILPNLINWNSFTTDGSNTNYATFNATASQDVIGSQVFNVGTSGNIYNFYTVFSAESTTQNAGKILLGYTDDNIISSPCDSNSCTDDLLINNRQNYRGTTIDFKALDADNDGKVRVWFTFKGGSSYSSFNFYEFYIIALGATTLQPLADATIYYSATKTTTSDDLGAYQLPIPLSTNLILYYKTGYESKNVTHAFNSTNPTFSYDIILNSTNKTTNVTTEYIRVDPNPITIGTQAYAYYKSLDHTNPLLLGFGNYQIAVCPLLGESDCDKYNVDANTESNIPLNLYGIGEYTIQLTGYSGGFSDFNRDVLATNNFTVISSTPSVNWGTGTYYLGEAMVLSIYVPSSSQIVNITYPNGTQLYGNSFSSSTTLYSVSFQTDVNLTFPPGSYTAKISGGNSVTTQLINQSAGTYSLNTPVSIVWGTNLNIVYVSPRVSTLVVTDQSNNVWISKEVSGSQSTVFNTSLIPNSPNVLNIKLIRETQKVAESNTTILINIFAPAGSQGILTVFDGWVSLLGFGVSPLSKFFFAWLITTIFIIGGFATGRGAMAGTLLGAGSWGWFMTIGYLPTWFAIIVVIQLALVSRWFR